MFETCEAEPRLLDGTGIKLDFGWWLGSSGMQTCIFDPRLTWLFCDLVYVATMLGIERPHSYSRLDLVTMIATQVGGEEFAKAVRAKEEPGQKCP